MEIEVEMLAVRGDFLDDLPERICFVRQEYLSLESPFLAWISEKRCPDAFDMHDERTCCRDVRV